MSKIQVDELSAEVKKLPKVSGKAALEYRNAIPKIHEIINKKMAGLENIGTLTGDNPLAVMFDNHKNHLTFISTVLNLGFYDLLSKTLPWVYRAYTGRKFSQDYFPTFLTNLKQTFTETLSPQTAAEVNLIYSWMIEKHETLLKLSQDRELRPPPVDQKWMETKNRFQNALLSGDSIECSEIAKNFIKEKDDIYKLYLYIIQSSLYDIGTLWEEGKVSVAQEHLASAIATRIIASISSNMAGNPIDKGKILVTSSSNEFHQIGAWMLSDILEIEGWNVRFLGANTPYEELFKLMRDFKPEILAVSVTMPFSIEAIKEMILKIKSDEELKDIKVLVGGKVFNENPELWKLINADGYASNPEEAVALIRTWEK